MKTPLQRLLLSGEVSTKQQQELTSIPSLIKKNVVPPGRTHGWRTWLVKTKTGVWKGASSGQSGSPALNIRFPMIPFAHYDVLRWHVLHPGLKLWRRLADTNESRQYSQQCPSRSDQETCVVTVELNY